MVKKLFILLFLFSSSVLFSQESIGSIGDDIEIYLNNNSVKIQQENRNIIIRIDEIERFNRYISYQINLLNFVDSENITIETNSLVDQMWTGKTSTNKIFFRLITSEEGGTSLISSYDFYFLQNSSEGILFNISELQQLEEILNQELNNYNERSQQRRALHNAILNRSNL